MKINKIIFFIIHFCLSKIYTQHTLLNLGSDAGQERRFCTEDSPCNFRLVADLDLKSRPEQGLKDYKSYYQKGYIIQDQDGKYDIKWDEKVTLLSGYNEHGRGMELSELIAFNGMMLAADDRTGILFEIIDDGKELVPRYVLSEGDGKTNKGMKIEWLAVRDSVLWVGSFGKEFISNGVIAKRDNMWVANIDKKGYISRFNWKEVYDNIRKALGATYPGYCIHEAVLWSSLMRKWIFLPRRVSIEAYDEEKDESKGSNKMVILSDDFVVLEIVNVGKIIPERGFSSLKFLPGSFDQVIVATKSVENSKTDTQNSYVVIFSLSGRILLNDVKVPGNYKYEGIEFV